MVNRPPPLTVLFLSNFYPPCERGGYEQLCRDVVEGFRQRGHDVSVLTSNFRANEDGHSDEAAVRRLLRLQPVFGERISPALQFFLTRKRDEAYNVAWLHRVLAEIRPDAVFIWNLQHLPRSLATAVEAVPGLAVAYWLAGYTPAEPDEFWHYWELLPNGRLKRQFKHLLSQCALRAMRAEGQPLHPQMRHVAVVSHFCRDQGIARGQLPPTARVIYNGVEVEKFYRPVYPRMTGPLHLLQAGRVSDDKGVHTSLSALSHLVNKWGLTDIDLTVAGSGPVSYQVELQQLVSRLNIEKYVTFTGWLPRDRMPDLMHQSHILLLPTSHSEPFARVVLEGMAAGLAVVATMTGGTGEIVREERTGLTFPAGDSRGLAEQIRRLALDDSLRCAVAGAGQQTVIESHSMERMVDGLEDLLAEAIYQARETNERLPA